MDISTRYRYPGSRPFQDTSLDRELFFGRDHEKYSLLNMVLAENLVVLFAKSGMGKTSLLNAGLMHALRERHFIPFTIRFNSPNTLPHEAIYEIEDTVEQQQIECSRGERDTLWQYFKTVEFWSADDRLLTPVLILDQFEEFFTFYPPESRQIFTTQFADLIKHRIPQKVQEAFPSEHDLPYTQKAPKIKVIISIREDYIGQLEEMSQEIPEILNNRFRLLPLHRDRARQAIEEPAQIEDTQIETRTFHYGSETVDAMLDFLCQRRKGDIIIPTDEVEPFQLQLLCQHVENIVRQTPEKQDIQKEDLGGSDGMQKVLEKFYEDQIRTFDVKWERRIVRNLFENGLISITDRRLSLEQEDIKTRFKVSPNLLAKLVNSRLLRVERRVEGSYYELSHDTLVKPIRSSQEARRKVRARKIIVGVCALFFVILAVSIYPIGKKYYEYNQGKRAYAQKEYDKAEKIFRQVLELDPRFSKAYIGLAHTLLAQQDEKKYEDALKMYQYAIVLTPDDADAHRGIGDTLSKQKNYEDASMAYRRAIELNPHDAKAYKGLGDALAFSQWKIYEEAIAAYQQAIQLAPEYADAYGGLGYVLLDQGENTDAVEAYQKAIQFNPEYADAYSGLGNALLVQGKETEAIKQFNRAIELDPSNVDAYIGLGNILLVQGKETAAIENFQQAIDLEEDPFNGNTYKAYNGLGHAYLAQGKEMEAIENFESATVYNSDDADAYKVLGDIFSKQKKYHEAVDSYKKADEINPGNADIQKSLGTLLFKLGAYDEAVEYLTRTTELTPSDADAYKLLGKTFFKQEKYLEAIENYATAIELAPEDADTYSDLGDTFSKLPDRYQEAVKNYEEAYTRNPRDAYAYKQLAVLHIHRGYVEEGIKIYQEAIWKNPENASIYPDLIKALEETEIKERPLFKQTFQKEEAEDQVEAVYDIALSAPSQSASYYYILGQNFSNLKKYEKAIDSYTKAIEVNPNYTNAYNSRGIMYGRLHNYAKAIENYQKAIELDSNYKYAYHNIGWIYRDQRKYEEAIEYFQKALEIDPQYASAYNGLGSASFRQENYDKAIEYYEKAAELSPKSTAVKMNLAEVYLVARQFEKALTLVNELQEHHNLSTSNEFACKFLLISSLLLHGENDNAFKELSSFIANYHSLTTDYQRGWSYATFEKFIKHNIEEPERSLLLKFIDVLESTKANVEKHKKLEELEKAMNSIRNQ